jgi:hypothetical protein
MNRDEHTPPQGTDCSHDSTARLTARNYTLTDQGNAIERFTWSVSPPPYTFEHDRENGVFRLKWSDGRVEVFRDEPARYLVVEADRQSGELRPAIKRGHPTYLYTCAGRSGRSADAGTNEPRIIGHGCTQMNTDPKVKKRTAGGF